MRGPETIVLEIIESFERGDTLTPLERYYADDVVVFENREMVATGKTQALARERANLEKLRGLPTFRCRDFAISKERECAFVEWTLRVHSKAGDELRVDEVCVYRFASGRIAEERHYFEGFVDEGDEEPAAGGSSA